MKISRAQGITVAAVSALVMGTAIGILARPNPRAQDRADRLYELALPAAWVPFSATMVTTNSHGESRGAFYRRSDGSTVTIIESPLGRIITIHNVTARKTYASFPKEGWVEYDIPTTALAPPKRSLNLAKARTRKLDQQIAGGDVYEFNTAGGTGTMRFAVNLNGYLIYNTNLQGAHELTDIVVGEPPDTLFTPPAGQSVKKTTVDKLLPTKPAPQPQGQKHQNRR
jgi:hypothetical protein